MTNSLYAIDVMDGIRVDYPALAIPEDMKHDAIRALNDANNLPHGGSHEENVSFGILFTTGENGYTAEIFAETEDGLIGFIPMDII